MRSVTGPPLMTTSRTTTRRLVVPLLTLLLLISLPFPLRAQGPLKSTVYASGFSVPVAFVQDPTDRTVQFVVEQSGRIKTVKSGTVQGTLFLDLTAAVSYGGEQGLLGLALAPDYATSRRFYVNFTNTSGNTVVARFKRSASNPLVADPASRFDLRWGGASGPAFIAQPYSNHNGGHLAFGPDGYLYIGLGDGGSGDDPGNRSQTPTEWLGKMLRIDVSVADGDASGYRVPADNPFVSSGPSGTKPEIWSYGLRNPWRYSFDDPSRGGTGALIIGDVGQGSYEEVDYEPANRGGRNYGWRYREGAHDHVTSLPPAYLPLTDPIWEYDRSVGQAVTGGYVYRGAALGSAYRGRYFFADYVRGRVWSLALSISGSGEATASNLIEHTATLGGVSVGNVSAFGVDADGELYVVSYSLGTIRKIQLADTNRRTTGDIDGDGKADITIYRPTTGGWWTLKSGTNYATYNGTAWGLAGDVPEPGDYDGDGKLDLAIYRPSTGGWWIAWSATSFATYQGFPWGLQGDVPVPADYDGDGRTDIAIYRPTNGAWWILKSSTNFASYANYTWGVPGDLPIPGDFDGDGKADPATYRPSNGTWSALKSGSGYASPVSLAWGVTGDVPVPGDYDGDGRIDPAIYRPSTGGWWIAWSSSGYATYGGYAWGLASDTPIPADYDGDGRTDIAVYRPTTGGWWVLTSSSEFTASGSFSWGLTGDVPIFHRP